MAQLITTTTQLLPLLLLLVVMMTPAVAVAATEVHPPTALPRAATATATATAATGHPHHRPAAARRVEGAKTAETAPRFRSSAGSGRRGTATV